MSRVSGGSITSSSNDKSPLASDAPATDAKPRVLDPNMPMEQAVALLGEGKITQAEYLAWLKRGQDALVEAASAAAAAKATKSDKGCVLTTRDEFMSQAVDLEGAIDGTPIVLAVKEFSTGGLGWFSQGKVDVVVGGKRLPCQLTLSLSVHKSKELPTHKGPKGPNGQ